MASYIDFGVCDPAPITLESLMPVPAERKRNADSGNRGSGPPAAAAGAREGGLLDRGRASLRDGGRLRAGAHGRRGAGLHWGGGRISRA